MYNENRNFDSFYFNEIIEGVRHSYKITGDGGRYAAEKDGIIIAKLALYEVWEQEDCEPLSPQMFEMLVHKIDDHLLNGSNLS